jgi:methionyl-tRNA synthetase
MKDLYNADLSNGIGNLVNRVMRLSEKYLEPEIEFSQIDIEKDFLEFFASMQEYDVMTAMNFIWKIVRDLDLFMQTKEPFKTIKIDLEQGKNDLKFLRRNVYLIAKLLNPFMPITSEKIKEIVKENKMPEKPLFPKYE